MSPCCLHRFRVPPSQFESHEQLRIWILDGHSPNRIQTEFIIHLQQIEIHSETEFSKQFVLARGLKKLEGEEQTTGLELRSGGSGTESSFPFLVFAFLHLPRATF